jgi:hypothetical protein
MPNSWNPRGDFCVEVLRPLHGLLVNGRVRSRLDWDTDGDFELFADSAGGAAGRWVFHGTHDITGLAAEHCVPVQSDRQVVGRQGRDGQFLWADNWWRESREHHLHSGLGYAVSDRDRCGERAGFFSRRPRGDL